MSMAEVDRLGVIKKVVEKRLRQRQAAKQLGIGVRQVKRLVRRYRKQGALGLVSRCRGRPSNRRISDEKRREMLELIHAHYTDFGPTLAREKLVEQHGHTVSKETLRRWMIAEGLWKPKSRKVLSVHQSRPRRACRGELVQIDGSPHAWFETRGPVCTLILFVDDATSALLAARFYPAETTQAYMEVLRAVRHTGHPSFQKGTYGTPTHHNQRKKWWVSPSGQWVSPSGLFRSLPFWPSNYESGQIMCYLQHAHRGVHSGTVSVTIRQ